ncbi:hypothetical protein HYC85_030960 [Camellia sinensis]|uniref:Uncharacterized protein n=1 Tax=Camellia sinensis TaxID=4442 RepID=A0A7J7FQ52_CAMSI|nr:hypothetical protein HYC85_030960 [Camellia sinensis]
MLNSLIFLQVNTSPIDHLRTSLLLLCKTHELLLFQIAQHVTKNNSRPAESSLLCISNTQLKGSFANLVERTPIADEYYKLLKHNHKSRNSEALIQKICGKIL